MLETLKSLNSDQAFSMLTHAIAAAGAMLAASGSIDADLQQLIMGSAMSLGSVVLGIWFNAGNTFDQVTSATRKLLTIFGTYACARGWLTTDQLQAWAGPIATISAVLWSLFFYRTGPGPDLAGTTLADPTPTKAAVIAGTDEGDALLAKDAKTP